jgi:Cytochrome P450
LESWDIIFPASSPRSKPHTISNPSVNRQGGKEISGYYFPAGSIVGANTWVIHRNKTIFGHDTAEFNPDRWLNPGRTADMDKYMFAFGGG